MRVVPRAEEFFRARVEGPRQSVCPLHPAAAHSEAEAEPRVVGAGVRDAAAAGAGVDRRVLRDAGRLADRGVRVRQPRGRVHFVAGRVRNGDALALTAPRVIPCGAFASIAATLFYSNVGPE